MTLQANFIPSVEDGTDHGSYYAAGQDPTNLGEAAEYGKQTHVLVVDDEPDVRSILIQCLIQLGHGTRGASNGKEALDIIRAYSFDVVVSDIWMPEMTGLELLRRIKKYDDDIAVIILTADIDRGDALDVMRMGADDYILKPFTLREVSLALDRALGKRQLKLQIRDYRKNLEKMIAGRTSQLRQSLVQVLQSLVFALEAKDPGTNGHSRRITWMAMYLGKAADLDEPEMELLRIAAILHDIGKIGIRESVLLKKGPLTKEEYAHVMTHPDIGAHILSPLKEFGEILPIIRHHHERFDGSGYPTGLRAGEIPVNSRILSIVDAFDAMTSAQSYRPALPSAEALSQLRQGRASQFDPELVDLFITLAEGKGFQSALLSPTHAAAGENTE